MRILVRNRKASFDYEILDKFVAGIILNGWEVKSLMLSDCSISDAYIQVKNKDVILKNSHVRISKKYDGFGEKNEYRDRVLLLTKAEKNKLRKQSEIKGLTIIPTAIVYSDTRKIKVELAICKGKKNYDKREALKNKQIALDNSRNAKY
jgi:SsrA-binding protein